MKVRIVIVTVLALVAWLSVHAQETQELTFPRIKTAADGSRVTIYQPQIDKLDFSDLFYDRLRSGRLPYLFGSSVILTEWRMRQTGARPSPSAAAGIPVEKDDSPAESKP